MKILVIGGGASGMVAALTAAQDPRNQVTLLERQSRVGRKLLATGNGRCNLSNRKISTAHYHGCTDAFLLPALTAFPVEDTLAFFETLGLLTVTEASGRVYPFSDQANSVLDVLRFSLERSGITVVCGSEVTSLAKKARGYSAKTAAGSSYYGDKVILACGGQAGGKLGGTDLGYRLLKSLGHRITDLSPSLVQVRTDTAAIRGLKGVRADAGLVLKENGATVAVGGGEVQFTDFGISGPAAFDLSRAIRSGQTLLLDLLRPWDEAALLDFWRRRREAFPSLLTEDFLTGALHNRLGQAVLRAAGLPHGRRIESLNDDELSRLTRVAKHFPLTVLGTMGFDQAQVTAGGADTSQFRADTLESRLCPGLFACGEVLDVDGDCGGYNLQWAWSSGRLAGNLGQKEKP